MLKINARDCEVKAVEQEQAHAFLILHHRQGATGQGGTTNLGLFLRGELLGIVQFCYPRTRAKQRLYTTELLRLCFKTGVRVRGGASKLIEHYRRNHHPADFFTYQDTRGEAGNVYKQAGMTLVITAKPKTYLVAPDRTIETAARKEYWSIAEVSRRGPDALIGTSLGEIYHLKGAKKGQRKTNPELFVEELGWHREEVKGDNVWEWRDENARFYTYKITATDSDKYYYGVKTITNQTNITALDCEQDNYWGSGGPKFQHWKNRHKTKLVKRVLDFYTLKVEALEAEEALIGDKYTTDPQCLNAMPGGAGHYTAPAIYAVARCRIHGEVKHLGPACLTCRSQSSIDEKQCPVHGRTKHQGNICRKCFNAALVTMKECPIHGSARHIGEKCFKCRAPSLVNNVCPIHGEAKFRNGQCLRCSSQRLFSERQCPLHGMTKFRGDKCASCLRNLSIDEKHCAIHGLTKHDGNCCAQCRAEASVSLRYCPIHGKTKHQGSTCSTCAVQHTLNQKTCVVHGLGYHSGDRCRQCISDGVVKMKTCEIHGLTPHAGDRCSRCLANSAYGEKHCDIHGMTRHQGSRCLLCLAASKKSLQTCLRHGEQQFYNGTCPACKGEKVRHTRSHIKKNIRDEECIYCQP